MLEVLRGLMVFIRVGGTFQVDDSGGFIIPFLSLMDFTDGHSAVHCSAVADEPDDNWRSWGPPTSTPICFLLFPSEAYTLTK